MRQLKTTEGLIASRATNLTVGATVETLGYSVEGDGCNVVWIFHGVTGQAPSQSPIDLNSNSVTDADGNKWDLSLGSTVDYNGSQWFPLPFGAYGISPYILGSLGFVGAFEGGSTPLSDDPLLNDPSVAASTAATVALSNKTAVELIANTVTYPLGTVLTLSGYSSPGDGGGAQWKFKGVTGQTPSQSPADLGYALINDANGNQWSLVVDGERVEININSIGGYSGATGDNAPLFEAIKSTYPSGADIILGDGVYGIGSGLSFSGPFRVIGSGGGSLQGGIVESRDSARTAIRYDGATNDPMIEFTPINGGLGLVGGGVFGLLLDCRAVAKGIKITSTRFAVFDDVQIYTPNVYGIMTDCFSGALAAAPYDTQHCVFKDITIHSKNVAGTYKAIHLTGDNGDGGAAQGNTSFNFFSNIWASSDGDHSVVLGSTDNNYFYLLRANAAAGFDSVRLESGARDAARYNQFHGLEAGGGVNATAASDGTTSSHNNVIFGLSRSNGSPEVIRGTPSGGSLPPSIFVYGAEIEGTPIDFEPQNLEDTSTRTIVNNKLDRYEDGDFTFDVVGGTTAGTVSITALSGSYVRTGNLVHVDMAVNYNSLTGTGDLTIEGLPFTINDALSTPVFSVSASNLKTGAGTISGVGVRNSNSLVFSLTSDSAPVAILQAEDDSAAFISVSGSYKVNA